MSDVPESRAAGDLSVVDAWRLLVKPVPSRPAASYVGIVAIIVLLNLSAIATIVAAAVPDPTVAAVFGLLHTALIPGALLAFALFLMAWWFAVPLVALNGAKPLDALKASFAASWANVGALLVYGLIFLVLAILASIPMGLGWLVLAPVATGASFASWREVFGD